ncbi:MAG: FAD/NAD(P)-binding protein [Nostoc sp.]
MKPSFLTAHTPTTIAIVGGGFSGSLVATHLLKTASQPLTIKLSPVSNAALVGEQSAVVWNWL